MEGVAGWNGQLPDDNAIGAGSIPKMTILAVRDPGGSVEPAFGIIWNYDTNGTSTKS
jgi:hypothetical protein